MKREFGKKLIEEVLPRLDLTHVVDCSGAYIPGHGTPTAILFGRNRAPVGSVVRTVRGIRGEPAHRRTRLRARVWSAIVAQTDLPDQRANSSVPKTRHVSRWQGTRGIWAGAVQRTCRRRSRKIEHLSTFA